MAGEYFARGAQVFYLHPVEVTEELFLTVHPTRDCALTPAEQAEMLAEKLNAGKSLPPQLGVYR